MPLRGRLPFVAGVVLSSAALAGCASDQKAAGSPGSFPWLATTDAPGSRKDLKDVTRLDLTYAQWQEQLGNFNAAEDSYRRVLQEHPGSVDAMIGLARLEQLAGRSESAEKAYVRAVRSAPANAQALDALGQFYASEKRWSEAASAHASASKAEPANTVYRHHYAVALARSGNSGEALTQFKQAVGDAEGHYNLGYIFYEQGRADLAEREFLQAVTLRPDLDAAQTMLDELRRGGDEAPMMARNTPVPAAPARQSAAAAPPAAYDRVTPVSATTADGYEPPQWQMPTRREASSLQEEQMRNQSGLSVRP